MRRSDAGTIFTAILLTAGISGIAVAVSVAAESGLNVIMGQAPGQLRLSSSAGLPRIYCGRSGQPFQFPPGVHGG